MQKNNQLFCNYYYYFLSININSILIKFNQLFSLIQTIHVISLKHYGKILIVLCELITPTCATAPPAAVYNLIWWGMVDEKSIPQTNLQYFNKMTYELIKHLFTDGHFICLSRSSHLISYVSILLSQILNLILTKRNP